MENLQPISKQELVDRTGVLMDKLVVWQGNIIKLEVDAIVNAANSQLVMGGGVDGAIH